MSLSCSRRSLSSMAAPPGRPMYRCPRCGADGSLTRWGHEHGHRRWLCEKCRRTFRETLGAIHFRSRIGSRLLVGIGPVLTAANMSVRALALSLGVDKTTALRYFRFGLIHDGLPCSGYPFGFPSKLSFG